MHRGRPTSVRRPSPGRPAAAANRVSASATRQAPSSRACRLSSPTVMPPVPPDRAAAAPAHRPARTSRARPAARRASGEARLHRACHRPSRPVDRDADAPLARGDDDDRQPARGPHRAAPAGPASCNTGITSSRSTNASPARTGDRAPRGPARSRESTSSGAPNRSSPTPRAGTRVSTVRSGARHPHRRVPRPGRLSRRPGRRSPPAPRAPRRGRPRARTFRSRRRAVEKPGTKIRSAA